jgi:hypothetical protein
MVGQRAEGVPNSQIIRDIETVIASEAKQSMAAEKGRWIASLRSQ